MHFSDDNKTFTDLADEMEEQDLELDDDFGDEGNSEQETEYYHPVVPKIGDESEEDEPPKMSAAARAIYADEEEPEPRPSRYSRMNKYEKAKWAEENKEELSKYNDVAKYSDKSSQVRFKHINKVIVGFIIAFILVIAGSGIALWMFMNEDHINAAIAETPIEKGFGATESDIDKLAEQGYDAKQLTNKAKNFAEKFFTLDSETIKDGSWQNSFINLVDYDTAEDLHSENMLMLRDSDTWKTMFDNHPYYATKLLECESIKWDITYYNDAPLPYCDITVSIVRPDLDFYTLNSIPVIFSEYKDTYRIAFGTDGKIIKVKRVGCELIEANVDATSTVLNAEAAKAYVDKFISEGNANTAKGIAEAAAKQAAEDEARRQAMEEAEKKRLEAEEEAKKKAEEEAQKQYEDNQPSVTPPSNPGSGNNGGSNNNKPAPGNNGGGNSNNGGSGNGNSGGNGNASSDEPSGNAGGGSNQNGA